MPIIGTNYLTKEYVDGYPLGNIYLGNTIVQGSNYIIASGGAISFSGSYKIHTFTTVGTSSFIVYSTGISPYNTIQNLIVGGGGASGAGPFESQYGSGGGGAGGVFYNSYPLISVGTYNVIIGDGGLPSATVGAPGNNGNNSSFNNLTAIGGGGGAYERFAGNGNGIDGGSGGGGVGPGIAGLGLQPSQSGDSGLYGYGNNGMAGNGGAGNGGGGGGAGFAPTSSVGGDGLSFNFETIEYYGGGGAGGVPGLGISVAGGLGGGGNIDNGSSNPGVDGTGGGGAGINSQISSGGKKGGSGIVKIKYQYKE